MGYQEDSANSLAEVAVMQSAGGADPWTAESEGAESNGVA